MTAERPVTPAEHYDRLLAAHYSWMVGDAAAAVDAERARLAQLGVPSVSADATSGRRPHALDLGAGPGVQSAALARLGYRVTAVDTSAPLLAELAARVEGLDVEPVLGDLRALRTLAPVERVREEGGYDVVVCMGDTLTHLASLAEVDRLFADARDLLAPGGVIALTFRDLTSELRGLDRFILVRGDAERVMTCFLESEPERPDTVVVHDLVHVRDGAGWALHTSAYRKLRLAPAFVAARLTAAGFVVTFDGPVGRLVGIAASKAG